MSPYTRDSVVSKSEGETPAVAASPWDQSDLGAQLYCAYNQTRERFLCVDVIAADFSPADLNARLPALMPASGVAIWIHPFRGISPTSVRVPIDLVYLDQSFIVLNIVDSFPFSQASSSSASAASVLALPAHSIASTEVQRGDRLILCAPEELRQRLLQPRTAKLGTPLNSRLNASLDASPDARPIQTPAPSQAPASAKDHTPAAASGSVLQWAGQPNPEPSIPENAPTNAPPISTSPPFEPVAAQPPKQPPTPSKNWLQRLLSPEPADPRKTVREPMPWLVGYFFTGGAPAPHAVRDISPEGLYVVTGERWYPGTIVRITLTDRRQPPADCSITVNGMVVRWGNDGVGLQFILADAKAVRRAKASSDDQLGQYITKTQIEKFLQRTRNGSS